MDERDVTYSDIIEVGYNYSRVFYNKKHSNWNVDGRDREGRPLTIACMLDQESLTWVVSLIRYKSRG